MLVRKGVTEPVVVGAFSGTVASKSWETWVWDGLALVQRGDQVFVNEAHPAGGQAIMSRTLNPAATEAKPETGKNERN